MKIRLNTIYKPKIIFKKKIFKCQIGENGKVPKHIKTEGDKSTPIGKWELKTIFIRKEKLKLTLKKSSLSKLVYIKKNYIWCDDKKSNFYNKLVKIKKNKKKKFTFEKMYRDDNVYDIIIEINYNRNPVIKNKGSAIFIHCSFTDLRPTEGCIAVEKNTLKFLINNLKRKNHIYIN